MLHRALLVACLLAATCASAGEPTVDYVGQIKPILRARCYACHGALRQRSNLRLDTAAAMHVGGDQGPAVMPGISRTSLIIVAVTGADGWRMPPEDAGEPLSPGQIELLRRWIDEGAHAPSDEVPQMDPRAHWAFRPPQRPPVPQVENSQWVINPIDAFIAAEHDHRGLRPAPEADRATLLRRVYVDLIGIPPTRTEIRAFVADRATDAYERVVDRLLADPRYAQRWARHWMDVWRYSDWYGKRDIEQHRNSRRHIWRWRDWIVESLAADMGFDRMVVAMLAGDELAPQDDQLRRATGYLGRNYYVYNRDVWLQDTVEYTAAGMLGLTFKCCRCHDHKYDPVTQEDYYRFRAFFEPYGVRTDRLPDQGDSITVTNAAGNGKEAVLKAGWDRVFDAEPAAPTYLLVRGNAKNPDTSHAIEPGLPAIFDPPTIEAQPVDLPLEVFYPDLRPFRQREMLTELDTMIADASSRRDAATDESAARMADAELTAIRAERHSLAARIAAELDRYTDAPADVAARSAHAAAAAQRLAAVRRAEFAVDRADAALMAARTAASSATNEAHGTGETQATGGAAAGGEAVATAEKQVSNARQALDQALAAQSETSADYEPVGTVYPRTSTGRRLALARWIASRASPLTARVAVNHIWMRHFGQPLVESVNDFGLRAHSPSHPMLLDWLAVEFMDHGWQMKHLHRLMVTSATYRMSSTSGPDDSQADPTNRYLHRMNVRRMEAEVVRDSLLHLAGRLDASWGGADLDPATDDVSPRRSMYFRHTPDDQPALLRLFDAADPIECFRRRESIRPQQPLALANGALALGVARVIAAQIDSAVSETDAATGDAAFASAAFEHVLGRMPSEDEQAACVDFLEAQTDLLRDPGALVAGDAAQTAEEPAADAPFPPPADDPVRRAREGLVHVLINHHDFITID